MTSTDARQPASSLGHPDPHGPGPMGAATARRRVPAPAAWLREFLRLEASGGLVLMAAAVLAMVVANSPLSDIYQAGLGLLFEVRLGSFVISKPLLLWINDGLMAIFFLLVGLELKREVFEGQLSTIASASLPAFAAVGGMAVPALVYAGFNWDDPVAMKGWAIPSATDIAFALGILSLLGDRVPPALKAFLLSVAVFDDLGAIVIIALFYTSELSLLALAVAATGLAALFALNRMRVTELAAYVLIGVVLWVSVLKSGVHATLAGVALAVFIPLRGHPGKASSPVDRLEHALHPWVAFAILPLFAFANAGVSLAGLSLSDLLQPVPLGIAAGLFAGKVIGIGALCAIAVGLGLAALPGGLRWSHIVGVSFLCGVGFTMSLFIASLAFEQGGTQYPGVERLGILVGSIVSGLLGYWILRRTLLDRPSRSVP